MELVKRDSQKYEYAFETIVDKFGGGVNLEKIASITAEKAKSGWRLITVFTNELGKDALSIAGVGVNSTADETVLVFEREIEQKSASLFYAEVPVTESNIVSPYVPKVASFFDKDGSIYVTLKVFSRQDFELKGLQGDLIVRNMFGDEITLEDICFFSFEKKYDGYLVSSPFPVILPDKISYGVSNAGLCVKRFIGNDKLEILENTTIDSIAEAQKQNIDGDFNIEAFWLELENYNNTKEIYEYILQLSEFQTGVFSNELLQQLESKVKIERMYGNNKKSTIQLLKTYFDNLAM